MLTCGSLSIFIQHCMYLFVCLSTSIYLYPSESFIHMSIYLPVQLPIKSMKTICLQLSRTYLSGYISIYLLICPSVSLHSRLPVCLPTDLSTWKPFTHDFTQGRTTYIPQVPSTYIYRYIYMFIYLSVYPPRQSDCLVIS